MPIVPAKCTQCGAQLEVDSSSDAAICKYCGMPFVVEKAINNYNNTINVTNVFHGANVTIVENKKTSEVLSNKEEWNCYKERFETFFERKHYKEAMEYLRKMKSSVIYFNCIEECYERFPIYLECELKTISQESAYVGIGNWDISEMKKHIIEMMCDEETEKKLFEFVDNAMNKHNIRCRELKEEETRKKAEEYRTRTMLRAGNAEDIQDFIGKKRFVGKDERTKKTIYIYKDRVREKKKYGKGYNEYACVCVSIGFWGMFHILGEHGKATYVDSRIVNPKITREFISQDKWKLFFEYDYKEYRGTLTHYVDVLTEM